MTEKETANTRGAVSPRRRILVVDDHQDIVVTLSLMLRVMGHETEPASDGDTALAVARAFRPDAVLLDIGLPGMDGYEVARRLRAEHGDELKLIALTGYGLDEDKRLAQEAGFDHHLVKPVDADQLERVLTESNRLQGAA